MSNLPHLKSGKIWQYCPDPFRMLLYILVVYFLVFFNLKVSKCNYSFVSSCRRNNVEARNNLGALNRTQQAYFLDYQKFTYTLDELGMGIPTETSDYHYRIVQPMTPVSDWKQPNPANWVMTIAQAKYKNQKTFFGLVWSETAPTTKEIATRAKICFPFNAGQQPWDSYTQRNPIMSETMMRNGQMQCPLGYRDYGD